MTEKKHKKTLRSLESDCNDAEKAANAEVAAFRNAQEEMLNQVHETTVSEARVKAVFQATLCAHVARIAVMEILILSFSCKTIILSKSTNLLIGLVI